MATLPGGGVLVAVGETAFGAYTLPHKHKVTIGRSEDNDVSINDSSISREHAVIHFGDDVCIEDVGSTNGTRVREVGQWTPDIDARTIAATERQLEKGERVKLVSGSIVMLGTVMLMFQARPTRGRPRRLWPRPLFEERVEEECARAAREKRTFALVRIRLAGATTPTATIDIDKQLVNVTTPHNPQHIAEDILGNTTGPGDVIATDEAGEYFVLRCPAAATDADELVARLEEAFKLRGLSAEIGQALYPRDGRSTDALLARAAKGTPDLIADLPHQIVVRDPQMIALHQLIERVAASDITVLLLGETGVGKEVIAEAIHQRSRRAQGPLVRINCAALPEGLLEGELFGYERGAFTGADKAKAGHFESAQGGTIFLDEVGEIPLSTQVKLLRVLEERKILRLGARQPTAVDARIIAATNRDLEQEVVAGRFRQDLFFRLNVFPLDIPPLRERTSEIIPLATSFVAGICEQMSRRPPPRLDASAISALETYAWPGNIRELRNVIHRAVLLSQGDVITDAHLPLERLGRTITATSLERAAPMVLDDRAHASRPGGPAHARSSGMPTRPPATIAPPTPPPGANLKDSVEAMERDRIIAALEECAGNQTRTAERLGITRRVLLNRLDRYGIPRPRK